MRVAFFASDNFAIPLLRFLAGQGYLCCLVTQSDKPRGRGLKESPLPIRVEAEALGIEVLTDENLKSDNFRQRYKSYKPDIPIVASYGLFVPKWIRDQKPFPCVNVHPSLLPRWRGADPVRRPIIEGDTITGVSLHFTEKKMDCGDIIMVSSEIEIDRDATYDYMRERLSNESVALVGKFLERLESIDLSELSKGESNSGKRLISRIFNTWKQDESLVTYANKLEKSELWIDWNKSANEIHNLIRGLSSEPSARTGNLSSPLKILKSRYIDDPTASRLESPGGILEAKGDILTVACGKDRIQILEIQPAGKKVLTARDFVNGFRLKPGDRITNI